MAIVVRLGPPPGAMDVQVVRDPEQGAHQAPRHRRFDQGAPRLPPAPFQRLCGPYGR
jgi:hypothetical protein